MEGLLNIEAEQAVLGAILNDNRQLSRVEGILGAESFSLPEHAGIWDEACEIIRSGRQASPITMLQSTTRLSDAPGYLAKLAGLGISVLDTRSFALAISQMHQRRQMLDLADRLKAQASDIDRPITDSIAEISREVGNILDGATDRKVLSAKQVFAEIMDDLGRELPCYSVGIPLLDETLAGGVYEGRSYAFAGRPKAGKTLLAGTITNNLAKQNVPLLFVAAEMGRKEILQRILAADIGRGALAFLKDRKSQDFTGKLVVHQRHYNPPLWFCDAPRVSFDELKMQVIGAIRKHGIKGFVLDGLNLVTGALKGMSEAQHLLEVAQWIAEICKKEQVFGIYTLQLNREGEMRGSDGAIMAGDQIYRIHRPSEDRPGIWLEMRESRYTPLASIGNESMPLLEIKHGSSIVQREGMVTQWN